MRASLSSGQLVSLVAVFVGVVALLIGSTWYLNRTEYRVLFSDLDRRRGGQGRRAPDGRQRRLPVAGRRTDHSRARRQHRHPSPAVCRRRHAEQRTHRLRDLRQGRVRPDRVPRARQLPASARGRTRAHHRHAVRGTGGPRAHRDAEGESLRRARAARQGLRRAHARGHAWPCAAGGSLHHEPGGCERRGPASRAGGHHRQHRPVPRPRRHRLGRRRHGRRGYRTPAEVRARHGDEGRRPARTRRGGRAGARQCLGAATRLVAGADQGGVRPVDRTAQRTDDDRGEQRREQWLALPVRRPTCPLP